MQYYYDKVPHTVLKYANLLCLFREALHLQQRLEVAMAIWRLHITGPLPQAQPNRQFQGDTFLLAQCGRIHPRLLCTHEKKRLVGVLLYYTDFEKPLTPISSYECNWKDQKKNTCKGKY